MDKSELRLRTSMSAFTFYIDDETKLEALKKLRDLGLDTKKGSLSAALRVLLREFATSPASDEMRAKIEQEYLFTTKKNKRSSL